MTLPRVQYTSCISLLSPAVASFGFSNLDYRTQWLRIKIDENRVNESNRDDGPKVVMKKWRRATSIIKVAPVNVALTRRGKVTRRQRAAASSEEFEVFVKSAGDVGIYKIVIENQDSDLLPGSSEQRSFPARY